MIFEKKLKNMFKTLLRMNAHILQDVKGENILFYA